jgi:hypothetical protein
MARSLQRLVHRFLDERSLIEEYSVEAPLGFFAEVGAVELEREENRDAHSTVGFTRRPDRPKSSFAGSFIYA